MGASAFAWETAFLQARLSQRLLEAPETPERKRAAKSLPFLL